MPEYRTFVPENIDLSNKELRTRVQDELKDLLENIRASVDVYPEDTPQYLQETQIFQTDKPQEVRLKDYPNIQKLYKSFIAEYILKGGGRQPYQPHKIEMFQRGVTDFYRESTDLVTEGTFDVSIINELGFGPSSREVKEFLKGLGIVGQRGFSRGLREIFRYFTANFKGTGLSPISAVYKGRNPELHDTLKSLPFLESVGEGGFIVKLLRSAEEDKTTFLDATDLVPVYKKYIDIKLKGDRTLPEQMQHIQDMRGTGTVRSMIDPSRQPKLLKQEQNDLFRYLVNEFSQENQKISEEQREQFPKKERKTVTFQPDPEEVPDIPEPRKKPKPSAKPSATSPLAQKLRQRAAARLEVENKKARQKLGIQPDDTKKPDPKGKLTQEPKTVLDPKGSTKGPGLLFYLRSLEHLWGAGSVTEKGEPLASLEDQMTKLTG